MGLVSRSAAHRRDERGAAMVRALAVRGRAHAALATASGRASATQGRPDGAAARAGGAAGAAAGERARQGRFNAFDRYRGRYDGDLRNCRDNHTASCRLCARCANAR